MTGIEKITKRIEDEAEQNAKATLEKAESEAEEILTKAKETAEKRAEDAISAAKGKAVQLEKRMISVGELEARKLRLGAKQESVETCFEMALNRLCAMDKGEYTDMLVKMAVGIVKEDAEIVLNSKDKAIIGSDLVSKINGLAGKWNITLSQDTIETRGGFVLRSGNVETNCRLEMLVKSKREELAPEVAAILFE